MFHQAGSSSGIEQEESIEQGENDMILLPLKYFWPEKALKKLKKNIAAETMIFL
jgi:hypothetical protein